VKKLPERPQWLSSGKRPVSSHGPVAVPAKKAIPRKRAVAKKPSGKKAPATMPQAQDERG
jgi:cell division protease FtsH